VFAVAASASGVQHEPGINGAEGPIRGSHKVEKSYCVTRDKVELLCYGLVTTTLPMPVISHRFLVKQFRCQTAARFGETKAVWVCTSKSGAFRGCATRLRAPGKGTKKGFGR
jgi:hypothetical protein